MRIAGGAPRPGARRRTPEQMARELGTRLPGLSTGLSMTGAGLARPMTAAQLSEALRVAYDPAAHGVIEQAAHHGGTATRWTDAGPMAAQEAWDHYVHDSGVSITWAMSEAPRGEVLSSVLTDLVGPHRAVHLVHAGAEAAVLVVEAVDPLLDRREGGQGGIRRPATGRPRPGHRQTGEGQHEAGEEEGSATHLPRPSEVRAPR